MKFTVGQHVSIVRLKKVGVITEVLGGGKVRVKIGAIPFTCADTQLEAVKAPPKKAPLADAAVTVTAAHPAHPKGRLERLDLHGMRVAEAILKLEEHLDRAALAKVDRVEVIHGIGTGKVKAAVLERLASLSIVERYAEAGGNPGTTIVYL